MCKAQATESCHPVRDSDGVQVLGFGSDFFGHLSSEPVAGRHLYLSTSHETFKKIINWASYKFKCIFQKKKKRFQKDEEKKAIHWEELSV